MKQAKSWLSIVACLSVTALVAGCGRPSLKEVFGITLNELPPHSTGVRDSRAETLEGWIYVIPPKPSSAFKSYAIRLDATNKVVRAICASSSEPEEAAGLLRQRYGQPDFVLVDHLVWTNAVCCLQLLIEGQKASVIALPISSINLKAPEH
jgi:hypothetical protein